MGNVNVQGGALEFDAIINMQQFQAQLNRMEASLQGITNTAKEQSQAIQDFAQGAAAAIGTYVSFTAGSSFISDLVRVRGEFQQIEVAFGTMLQSKEKADKLMAEVVQLAATTPFTLQDVATGAKQLLAYGFAADTVVGNLRMLGDIAAGVGAPLGDIVYLYGTLQTQGRAYTRDIMQFTSRGIPIIDALAKEFGVTKDKVQDLVEAGKVGFPEVEKAFQGMTSEGGVFFNLMDQQSKTLTGQLSNLQDAWSQMLNEIGKSNQGVFSEVIEGATSLVENYQKVLDILKVLVITYGSYKAAILATNVVNSIAISLTQGYTIAETLRYQAMLLSEKAMALLNKTMLKNPYVAVATGIAAVVSAFLIFNKTASEVKTKSELIADAQEKLSGKLAETEAKIRPYEEALKKANISEQERINIYNKLLEIDPKIVQGLDAKTLSYDNLAKNVNIYLDALRQQIALEANKDALQESIKQEQALQKKLDKAKSDVALYKQALKDINANLSSGAGQGAAGVRLALEEAQGQVELFQKSLEDQKKISSDLAQTQVQEGAKKQEVHKRTLKDIDDEIAAVKKQQQETSTNSKEYQDFQKKINALQEERKKIAGESKKEISETNALESKTNSILEQRKSILQSIQDLQRDAKQSGLVKEQSEIDKVNQKYDDAIRKITDFNGKVDEFNKKNKTNVQKIGQVDIQALNDARQTELDNTRLKQDADRFKQNLENQKNLFSEYEDAKKTIGVDKANELFREQLKGYTSYLDLLKSEANKIAPKIVFGIANIGDIQKMQAITKEINDTEKKNEEDLFKERVQNVQRLLSSTASYNQQRLDYEKQYQKDVDELRKDFSGKELEERLKVLKDAKSADLKALAENLAEHTKGWRALNKNIIDFTAQRVDQEINTLETALKSSTLSEQAKNGIKQAIEEWKKLRKQITDAETPLDKIIEAGIIAKGIFGDLASAVEPLDQNLSNALNSMSQLVDNAVQVSKSFDAFKTASKAGDVVGQITAATDIVTAVIKGIGIIVEGIKKTKEQLKAAKQAAEDFATQLITGEEQYQALIRQRQRAQAASNKLTLDAIEAQKKLLEAQKQSTKQEEASLFSQLQSLTYVTDVQTKKKSLFKRNLIELFSGGDQVKQVTESLAGKTYDQLEELFTKGQLVGKAKDLFEQLKAIHDEGADIDQQLADLKEKAAETFTGTTADSIADSIVDGFKNGLHSASDFAGTFEDLMRGAMINALKFQYLEGPLKDFFDQFAAASQSDNTLTQSEIDDLKKTFNSIITNADTQFQQLQQIAGINFGSASSSTNSLQGAIKGMTEQTAELIAGQFGGLRLTAIDQLNLMRSALQVHQNIEANTGLAAVRIQKLLDKFDAYETGTKSIKIQ